MITRTPVDSSNIVSIGHDADNEVLEIEFKGGAVYTYVGVSKAKYDELVNADSIGKHFHAHIRNSHAASKG